MRNQIRGIQLIEYFVLGLLACLTGLILSLISAWLMAWFYFDLAFVPDFFALFIASLIIIALTLLVGIINMKGILNRKPLEVLRLGTN